MRLGVSQGLSTGCFVPSEVPFTNTYSVAFDGTDDYADTNLQPDFIHTDATVSVWVKMGDFTGVQIMGTHNSKRFYFGFNGTKGVMGIQNAHNLSSGIQLSSIVSVGQWHQITVVADGGTATYYLDGVARTTLSYTPSASTNPTGNIFIGAREHGGNATLPFNASIDEFAICNTALDSDAVAAVYNSGIPMDLSNDSGDYDNSSALQGWWRMGDATEPAADGTDDFIFDQQDKTLGSELITNGTFDSNVTSWPASSGGTVTWSSGTAITGAVGTDDRGGMSQTFTTVNGAVYQLSFDVISRTSTKWEVYRQGTGAGTIIEGTALGSQSIFFAAVSTSTELAFYAKQAGTSDGTVAWDNISVKKVNGSTATMTNMDSGDIEEDTP